MHGAIKIMTNNDMPAPIAGLGWCVLGVWSGQEWNVQREIVDYPTYLPLERRIVIIRGRRMKKDRPLISGYLFVQVDIATDKNWGKLGKQTQGNDGLRGSMGMLKNNDKPVVVPDRVIERIKTAENAGIFDYTGRSPFQLGDKVEITEGPMAGLIGKIKSASPRKRARLLLGALGEAEIDTAYLRKVGT
jgi:transcription antitermination factor NusG